MKTLLSIAISSLALGAMAAFSTDQITTSTTIGVTKINTKLKSTVVAVPYSALLDGQAIPAGQLVKAANLPDNTMLYTFEDGTYGAYLKEEKSTVWTKVTTAGTTADGVSYVANPPETLALGSAIWIVLPKTPDSTSGQDIVIYGLDPESISQTVEQKIKGGAEATANLIANPLQETGVCSVSNPVKGDSIQFPSDTELVGYTCVERDGGLKWKHIVTKAVVDEIPDVPAGCGFWYVRKAGAGEATVTWTAK